MATMATSTIRFITRSFPLKYRMHPHHILLETARATVLKAVLPSLFGTALRLVQFALH
jgi:hypothetical protein